MKFLLTIILSTCLFSAHAKKGDKICISSNGKSAKVEVRFTSAARKTQSAVFTVYNSEGKVMSTLNSDLLCGDNSVCLCEALDLPEGTYTVTIVTKKKRHNTQFIIWK